MIFAGGFLRDKCSFNRNKSSEKSSGVLSNLFCHRPHAVLAEIEVFGYILHTYILDAFRTGHGQVLVLVKDSSLLGCLFRLKRIERRF